MLGDDLLCETFRDAQGASTSAFVPAAPAGPRTPFFLVPALGLDGRSFAPLAPLAPERRVVFWNLPNALEAGRDMGAVARLTLAHADRAGLPERFVIGGASLGAVIALAAAIEAPQRIAGLVLMGGSACWSDLGMWIRTLRWFHPAIPRRGYHRAFARILVPGRVEEGSIAASLRAQMEHRSKDYCTDVIAALTTPRRFDLRPRLAEVTAPTLVLHAAGDPVIPHRAVRALQAIPDVRVVTLETADHLPFLDAPADCLGALQAFLAAVDEAEADGVAKS